MDGFLWSDTDKDKIATLLMTGLSASKIAAHFTGVSRNAIIGVVSRDKRLKAIGLSGRPVRSAIAKPAQPVKHVSPTVRRVAPPIHVKPPRPLPPPDIVAPVSLDVLLHELGSEQCKWPVNDPPKGEPYLFRGHQRAATGPYCPYHKSKSTAVPTHLRARAVDSVDR